MFCNNKQQTTSAAAAAAAAASLSDSNIDDMMAEFDLMDDEKKPAHESVSPEYGVDVISLLDVH